MQDRAAQAKTIGGEAPKCSPTMVSGTNTSIAFMTFPVVTRLPLMKAFVPVRVAISTLLPPATGGVPGRTPPVELVSDEVA